MNTRHANPAVDALDELRATLTRLDGALRRLRASGLRGFACSPDALERLRHLGLRPADGPETLTRIREDLGDCRRCGLCRTRTHIVFGDGDPKARLVFVGEGPGRDEDLRGAPFVGAAGQLLSRIIAAMGLTRDQVYLCNVVKCRPPENRTPDRDEIEACRPFVVRQVAAVAPEMICTLGAVATQTLLDTRTPLSRLRGRLQRCGDTPLMPTFHPAHLLRHPEHKRDVWEDMKTIMRELALPLP